ncbi:MAG: dTMP kinase [Patescibacteria group bacterium]
MNKGKYIVLEGPQGVGKTVQLGHLANRLKSAGLPVRLLREPDSQSHLTARAIRQITQDPHYPLNTKSEVLLYNAARALSLDVIRQCVDSGIICLVDRSYLSTLVMQFYGRGDIASYESIEQIIKFAVGENEPDLTVILDAPVNVIQERTRSRFSAERFDNLDVEFLERCRTGYLLEAKKRNFPVVFATKSIEEITDDIWQLVTPVLATRQAAKHETPAASVAEILQKKPLNSAPLQAPPITFTQNIPTDPYLEKLKNGTYKITPSGYKYLENTVTNIDSNVYGFTDKLSTSTIAAAMARLSRRGDDMRITILDEFTERNGKDQQLLNRVITAYGDDSVQQLVGQHLVVENASNLLTKKLEWGRLAAYLEQSTRYIFFDQKDQNGNYKYFTPAYLKDSVKNNYKIQMDTIFDKYSELVHKLTDYVRKTSTESAENRDTAWKAATRAQACDAARPVLPVATTSTVGIFASGQALESLIMHLRSDELPEANEVGQNLLAEARKSIPVFLERADIPERGLAWQGYRAETFQAVKATVNNNIKSRTTDFSEPVRLNEYWPKNELDLLPDILYEHSDLSLEELKKEISGWSYQKREKAFKTYFGERFNRRHKPGRAIEKAHYSWDLVCDYGIFRDLQRHRIVDALEWQQLSPRMGYEIPELIEKASLQEIYQDCFDISLELYSNLQSAGYLLEAQYATLLGHKMRWKVTYNARQAFHHHELRTTPQGHPGYRKLVNLMHEKLCEVHPLIGESMKFVNSDEDPELTRLAAERYTQQKLQHIE